MIATKYFLSKTICKFLPPIISQSVRNQIISIKDGEKLNKNKYLKFLSFLLIPFLLPLILFQVNKSWNMAEIKLKEGAKIEFL